MGRIKNELRKKDLVTAFVDLDEDDFRCQHILVRRVEVGTQVRLRGRPNSPESDT